MPIKGKTTTAAMNGLFHSLLDPLFSLSAWHKQPRDKNNNFNTLRKINYKSKTVRPKRNKLLQ